MRQGYPAHTCGARQKRGTTHGTPAHATADGHRTSRGGMRRLGHSVCTRRGPRGRPRTTRSAKSRHECSSRPRTCVRECDACVWPCRACMRWQSRRERLSVRMSNGRASLADPARPAAPVDRPVRVRAYGIACARACVCDACARVSIVVEDMLGQRGGVSACESRTGALCMDSRGVMRDRERLDGGTHGLDQREDAVGVGRWSQKGCPIA